MDLNKFTQKSQEAISEAQSVAVRFGHQQVEVEHLALALLEQEQGLVPRLLDRAGYNAEAYAGAVGQELEKLPKVSGPGGQPGQIYVSQRLNSLLLKAV
ncbi:MAG: Clp protease N-terminal domain-containing protein, partial [Desulfohalobiaceae bacterium]